MSLNVPMRASASRACLTSVGEGRWPTLSNVAVTLTFDERISAGGGRCSVPSTSGSKMAVMVLTVRTITLVANTRKQDSGRENMVSTAQLSCGDRLSDLLLRFATRSV